MHSFSLLDAALDHFLIGLIQSDQDKNGLTHSIRAFLIRSGCFNLTGKGSRAICSKFEPCGSNLIKKIALDFNVLEQLSAFKWGHFVTPLKCGLL